MSKSLAGLSVLVAVVLVGCSSGAGTTSNSMIQAPPMPTVTLTAAASSVAAGGTTTLNWSSTDATSCSATGAWAGTKTTSGSEATAAINADSTYTLSCTGTGGTATNSATVTVAPAPTVTISAVPTSVAAGGTSTLTWSSTNSTSCTASGGWSGPQQTSGSTGTTAINADTTYTLNCGGTGGSAGASATVTVVSTPSVTLSAAPTSVAAGGSSTLTWGSANVTSCTASGGWSGTKTTSGSATVSAINSTTTYTLTCNGAGGNASASATVTVVPAPTVTLSASPSSITSGASSTLTWSSTNATSCTASGGWSGSKSASGSTSTGALSTTTSYTLTCTGTGGQASATATVTVGGTSVTVSPRVAPLTLGQTQQFTASGGGTVSWSVDGVGGGNTTVGTISSNGLYVPPAAAGTHTVTATSVANSSFSGSATAAITDLAGVYSYHNDLARSGQNLKEYALTKALVSGGNFGKRWACTLDGDVYAQPLYVANLTVNGGTHNVVFVATNHDSVYAFDADSGSCTPLWMKNFLTGGATTIPATTYSCLDSLDEYGIVGTPVIDPANGGTLYAVASTKEGSSYVQRLHALDITTGNERTNSPQVLAPTYPWTGGTRTFDPKMQLQRAGLVYTNGSVFVAWSSHCDDPTYYGWIASYDGATLAPGPAFNVAPNGAQGGIWMSGAAPAVDKNGSIYLSTGNGSFKNTGGGLPAPAAANDFSMSFLNFDSATLMLNDFYTPSQEKAWSDLDLDISAPGVMVLPDGSGPSSAPNLLYGGDKQGHIWLLNRLQLGDYSANNDNVVQMLDVVNLAATGNQVLYLPPAYYSSTVYASPVSRPVQAMALSGGVFSFRLNTTANRNEVVAQSFTLERCDFPGCGISISAAGSAQAIAWVLDNGKFGHTNISTSMPLGPAVLRAYDATNLATRLYTSAASANDTSGNALKFTIPMIANGRVYVGGTKQLTVYGIAP